MDRRDLLLMKLAALQMKHYGVVDPAFVKEAAGELEQLTAGQGSVDPTGTAAGANYAVQPEAYAPGYPSAYPAGYPPIAPDTVVIQQQPPAWPYAGIGAAGGAAGAATLAALLARKRQKNKNNR
jgi:hypothetical protein